VREKIEIMRKDIPIEHILMISGVWIVCYLIEATLRENVDVLNHMIGYHNVAQGIQFVNSMYLYNIVVNRI